VISPIQKDTLCFLDGENWEVRRYLPFFMPLYLYTMATARPFAYNPGSLIPGTEQVGDLSIGAPTSGFTNNPQYWNGPDEELGYVIAAPVSGNTQPTPLLGVFASVGFYRTSGFSDSDFINLSQSVSSTYGTPQTFSTANDASNWLTNNGFWNSFIPIPETPTPTPTVTPTNTNTPTNTQTPTVTPTVTQTTTRTPTPTRTPTQTTTRTPTPTRTQTPTPTPNPLPIANVTGATTNGGVYVSSSSPFGTGTSYLFNGTTGYLSYSARTDFALGTGDFTIEWFQYQTSQPSNPRVFQIGNYASQSIGCSIEGSSASCIFYIWVPGASNIKTFTSSGNLNSWIHFAIVRIGTSLKVYQNGVQIGSTLTNSSTLGNSTQNLSVGQETSPTANSYFPGNITQFRWTKGLGIYTGNFTTPTGPLSWTSDANPFGGVNTSAIGSGFVKVILQ
jgi:hypothetical protein